MRKIYQVFKFHAFKSNRMANTHHKKYKKSKGQSYAHNPVDRTLNKTLYQGLQCLHHIGNTQPADSTFGGTLRMKRAELTRFIQPAQNDETFQQVCLQAPCVASEKVTSY